MRFKIVSLALLLRLTVSFAIPLHADSNIRPRGQAVSRISETLETIIHITFLHESAGQNFAEPYPRTIEPRDVQDVLDDYIGRNFDLLRSGWLLKFHNGYNGSLTPPFDLAVNLSSRVDLYPRDGVEDEGCPRYIWCTRNIEVVTAAR
ncbi:hypothetical protein F5878DRAFT_612965 [Lentinula raphanica]|uniref:Uncharacterized protein n=1 Tax=Lentinula raphanica TaxID=153919 RepID=A0AA38PCQ9_9AGAR|nr:hypothetical protein F5878DRAFT_612965 [Lentinula raphanica]